jgi:hypothetical protein
MYQRFWIAAKGEYSGEPEPNATLLVQLYLIQMHVVIPKLS